MKQNNLFLLILYIALPVSLYAQGDYRIAYMLDDLPGHQPELALGLASSLLDYGFDLQIINSNTLMNDEELTPDRFDMLLLPFAGSLPAESIAVVENYIAQGGDVVTLGAPAFTNMLWFQNGRWYSEERWRARLNEQNAQNIIESFENVNLDQWQRHTNTPDSSFTKETTEGYKGNALHIHIEQMAGWDGLASPSLQNPFPEDHSLTVFYAKGTGDTRVLSLEWIEKDGSRWIAVFPVDEEWRKIVLTPNDFKFWESHPERGGEGDHFQPQNAERYKFGVAWTHTGPRGGEYEFFIDEFGTAPNPIGDKPMQEFQAPKIEGFSPAYKFYPIHQVSELSTRSPLGIRLTSIPMPEEMMAHHPRPTGKGFNKGRSWRWIPILEAYGLRHDWRGAPASIFVDFEGKNRGSIRAAFSISDVEWYRKEAVVNLIVAVIEKISRGLFLQEAGAEYFTYQRGESVHVGATMANLSRIDAKNITLRFELLEKGNNRPSRRIIQTMNLPAGETLSVTRTLRLPKRSSEFQLAFRLYDEKDYVIDEIFHELHVYRPKSNTLKRYVTAHDGDFYLDNKKWYVHGVNYMPSTGIAIEDGAYFEYWLGGRSYDPEFIQRDLERCKNMGLNSVSIFIYRRSLEDNNLLDILRRCRDLDLKVNLSIRPGTPMNYQWEWWNDIIHYNQLWDIDTIYAYDIAWEPFFGTLAERRNYDPQWRQWIMDKYSSIEKAEETWGVPAPRYEGDISSPTAEQLGKDGDHRKMVTDYRAFVDELIYEKYQNAANQIKSIDPNHLISFRMTVTGDPTYLGDQKMPYDFKGVECMDFFAPEGYGRIGSWEQVKPGMFTVSYARHCAPEKPVLWAEAGVHVWDAQAMRIDPDLLEYQANYYADFYEMVLQSYSNGVVWWWYPGGYRYNEKSDYGIINPDGTDRPVTKVIRQYAEKVLAERTIPQPDVLIEIDRDADARGLYGLYQNVKDEYWQAVEAGRFPGLIEKQ